MPFMSLPESDSQSISSNQSVAEAGTTSVLFAISGKSDIASDNIPHKVCVLIRDFGSTFQYSSVPKLAAYSYLKAKAVNDSDYPLLPGKSNIFFENSFVANSELPLISPSEEFLISLGVDESLKIEYKLIKKLVTNEGLITKKAKTAYEYQIIVTNNKKTREEIHIFDQIPLSNHEEITVELIEPEYKKESAGLKMDDRKSLEWTLSVDA